MDHRHGAHPDVLEFPLGAWPLRLGVRLRGCRLRAARGRGRIDDLPHRLRAVRVQGCDLLEDDGGNGRCRRWPRSTGAAQARRAVRVLPSRRRASTSTRSARPSTPSPWAVRSRLADGVDEYDPFTTVRGLPVFPNTPLANRSRPSDGRRPRVAFLETHWGEHETRVRQCTAAWTSTTLSLPVHWGCSQSWPTELIEDRPEWREMTTHVRTVATQAFQVWLRPDEPTLGWPEPGVTISAYLRPFETWASMPQTLWAEDWPDDDRPGTVAYFCGSLNAPWPTQR